MCGSLFCMLLCLCIRMHMYAHIHCDDTCDELLACLHINISFSIMRSAAYDVKTAVETLRKVWALRLQI